jgi:hypothetical protein
MKNKKSIIAMLFSILVLPIALLFTACGTTSQLDTKATCDTRGTYQTAATTQELNETIGSQEDFATDGYRISSTIKMTMTGGSEMNISFNAIYKNNELAIKMVVPDIMATIQSGKMKYTNAYAYYKGGYIYATMNGEKVKYQAQIEDMYDIENNFQYIKQYSNVEQLLNLVKSSSNISVFKDGNNFKVDFADSVAFSDASMYLNFNAENVLKALNLQFNISASTMNIGAAVTMSPFDGEIEFPDLSSYTLTNNI